MSENQQARVLIVEDHETNRLLLREHVAMSGWTPVMASDGLEALDEIHAAAPDMVILDLMLPRLDGMSVLRRIRSNPEYGRMPIMVISAGAEFDRVSECIELGASDFLPKPFAPKSLQTRLRHCLGDHWRRNSEDSPAFGAREFARQLVSSLGMLRMATSNATQEWSSALVEMLEQFAPETRSHLNRASTFCRTLSQQLSADRRFAGVITDQFVDDLAKTAGLHDIGKLAVPDSILSKPGTLDPDEHRIMRRHVTVGAEILRELYRRFPDEHLLELAIDLTLYHHERWDGMGYPFGLSGESIPLAGRIMAVADVYDALRSERSYKSALSHEKSRDIIVAGSGSQFDPAIVAGFIACEQELERLFDASFKNTRDSNNPRMTPHPVLATVKARAMTA